MDKKWMKFIWLALILIPMFVIMYYQGCLASALWIVLVGVVVFGVWSNRVNEEAKRGRTFAIDSARQEGVTHYKREGMGNVFTTSFFRVANNQVEKRRFTEQDGDVKYQWDGDWTVCEKIPEDAFPISELNEKS